MIDKLDDSLEDLKSDLNNNTEGKPVTTKAAPKKKLPPKKAAAKPAKPAKAKTKKDPNSVSLKDLASKLKIEPRDARKKLRKAGVKTEGRWSWPAGSADLKKVESILSSAG